MWVSREALSPWAVDAAQEASRMDKVRAWGKAQNKCVFSNPFGAFGARLPLPEDVRGALTAKLSPDGFFCRKKERLPSSLVTIHEMSRSHCQCCIRLEQAAAGGGDAG